MTINIKMVLTLALVTGVVAGCASRPMARLGSPELYSKRIQQQLSDGDIRAAESTLGEMELYYPSSIPTQEMQLKLINAYYKSGEFDRTVVAAKRFTGMFPRSEDLDRVHYLSGMANYDRGLRYLGPGSHEKSPLHAKAAKESFVTLLHCCAESRYANEASERAAYIDEALAQYEFGLMRAELLKGNRDGAVAKGKALVDSYPITNAAGVAEVMLAAMERPEVLDRLLIATALTINQDEAEAIAQKAGMVLPEPVVVSAAERIAEPISETVARVPEPVAMNEVKEALVVAQEPEPEAVQMPAPAGVQEGVPAAVVAEAEPKSVPFPVVPVVPVVTAEPVKAAKPPVVAASNAAMKRYTVQLGSSRRLATVQRYMQRLGLGDAVSYEQRVVHGEPWHAATYGAYADLGSAQSVASELMARTGITDLWVRPLGSAPLEPQQPRTIMAASEPAKARPVAVAKTRDTGRYAIQVASEQSLDSLKAEMRALKLEGKVVYFRRMVGKQPVYSALYGSYDTMPSAQAELAGLEARIKKRGLWVRTITDGQEQVIE